jgi:Ternary complex associated domain 9
MMDQLNSIVQEALLRKFVDAGDARLRAVALGDPDATIMALLLAALTGVTVESNIRYLAPGRSGAKVVVLINPQDLPVVVKFGLKADIEREQRNYTDSRVEERISQEIRPALRQSFQSGEYASLVYSWAGGLEQVKSFREFFRAARSEELEQLVIALMKGLFPWHNVRKSTDLPFDQWQWDDVVLSQVLEIIQRWHASAESKQKLTAALQGQDRWRDTLLTKHGSVGTCHGDLNCHNILVANENSLPKLIDFASVSLADSPARDYAKLEREIKLRCLRDVISDSAGFVSALDQVDRLCAAGQPLTTTSDQVTKTARLVTTLRNQFCLRSANLSDIPFIEYLYFLFCWTLGYLTNHEGVSESVKVRDAIIDSAERILDLLDRELRNINEFSASGPKSGYTPLPSTQPDPIEALASLQTTFLSQLRIAGYVADEQQSRRAVYLDEGLYVHRTREEKAINDYVREFVAREHVSGKWISIVGDAGHGKSSLLWYLCNELSTDCRLMVAPFMAQVESSFASIEQTVQELRPKLDSSQRLVVLIDTLDIAVGINDRALAALLHSLKALDALLVTTSRQQEADSLSALTPSDYRIALRRYTNEEAQQAIWNQIRVFYHTATEAGQTRQFEQVWGLLEQQREIRELDLEPLILRMIFEAYAPEDIPRDLNTQQVYQRYWQERVIFDRTARNATERFERVSLCRLIARRIAFADTHSDKLPLQMLAHVQKELGLAKQPMDTVEDLVSSGVLLWAEGRSSIRFFHQTFLEYAAAYDLLCSDSNIIQAQIKILFNDVATFNFFNAPILKQLAIQAYEGNSALHVSIMNGLHEINNELAAQLALEILGKVQDSSEDVEICRQWIKENAQCLQGVICETVRHYPRRKTEEALELLEPYLTTNREIKIYAVCKEVFAKSEPELVRRFLHQRLPRMERVIDNARSYYKNALCATFQYGAPGAVDDVLTLLPMLKVGQLSGLLDQLGEIVNRQNASDVVRVFQGVLQLISRLHRKRHSEIWGSLTRAVSSAYHVAPEAARDFAQRLLDTKRWNEDDHSARSVGRIVGEVLASAATVNQSFADLRSADHLVRLFNTNVLAHSSADFDMDIMSRILSLEVVSSNVDQVRSLFYIVSNLKNIETTKILQFLECWPWPSSGSGNPLRTIFQHLALSDPLTTKVWLSNQLVGADSEKTIKLLTALSLLLQENAQVYDGGELGEIYEVSLAFPASVRQAFAATIGAIASVDRSLAQRAFSRVFTSEGKECQISAINSLGQCFVTQPDFALAQGPLIIRASLATHSPGLLDNYLVTLKDFPRQLSHSLLTHLDEWFTATLLEELRDEKILCELLNLLKIAAESDPALAFEVSRRVPVISKGVAGGQAPLYDQISKYSDELGLLTALLAAVAVVSPFNQVHIGNALRRTLPRLSQKLGVPPVIEMIFKTYKQIENEQALQAFFRAAFEIPGWSEAETATLLKEKDLPSVVRSLLSARVRR